MGFIESYKHLEKICGEIMNDERRLSAYIDEMLKKPNGAFYVSGWNEDLKQLKHYRWVRNQISHEPGCTEQNMCEPSDTMWLDNFYARIMNQTDPLALYYQATKPRTIQRPPKMQNQPQIYHTSTNNTYNQTYKHNKKTSHKPVGCITFIVCTLLIVAAIIYFLK